MDNRQVSKESSVLRGQTTWSDFDMWYTFRMESSFQGYVSNTRDALLLFEAAHRGLIPKSRRRLKEEESRYLRSGQVFIFDENASGIKRWTDGLLWSPSRVLSNFLVYRQVDKKQDSSALENLSFMQSSDSSSRGNTPPNQHNDDGVPTSAAQASSADIARFTSMSPSLSAWTGLTGYSSDLSAFIEPPLQSVLHDSPGRRTREQRMTTSPQVNVWSERQSERDLVGSLRGSHLFSRSGLCKKTISVHIDGTTLHLVAYFTIADVRAGYLATPSSLPRFASLPISPDIVAKTTFRFPPKIIRASNGTSMMVLDDDIDHGPQDQQEQRRTPPRTATLTSSYLGNTRERPDPVQPILSESPSRASSAPLDTRMQHLFPTTSPQPISAGRNTLLRLTSEQVQLITAGHMPMQRSVTGDLLQNYSNSNAANTYMQHIPHDTQIGHSMHRQPSHMWHDTVQWKPNGLTGTLRRNALVDDPQSFPVHPASDSTPLEPGHRASYSIPGVIAQQGNTHPRHLIGSYDRQHQTSDTQHDFGPSPSSSSMWTPYRDMGLANPPDFMHSSDMHREEIPSSAYQSHEGIPPIVGSQHYASTYSASPHLPPSASSSLQSSMSQTPLTHQPDNTPTSQLMMSSMPAGPHGRHASSAVWAQQPVALTEHAAAYYAAPLSLAGGSTQESHEPPG